MQDDRHIGRLSIEGLRHYEVIGLTYDRDRIDEAPQGSQIAIDSRRESAIVSPPGMSVRINQIASPPLAIGAIESQGIGLIGMTKTVWTLMHEPLQATRTARDCRVLRALTSFGLGLSVLRTILIVN